MAEYTATVRTDSGWETSSVVGNDDLEGGIEVLEANRLNPSYSDNEVLFYRAEVNNEERAYVVGEIQVDNIDALKPEGEENNAIVEPILNGKQEEVQAAVAVEEGVPVDNWLTEDFV